MFEWLVETFRANPYLGVAAVFLACGLGVPLPEEIVLLFAGFVCYLGDAERPTMIVVCIGSLLLADVVPFTLGRLFGPRLLRIRLMRIAITPERLARFDRWFRRRGDLVVFLSRFITGIRMVSFFTAGTMRMGWMRFVFLDLAGVLPLVFVLVTVGDRYGSTIEAAINHVQTVERSIVIAVAACAVLLGAWSWLRWRRRQRALVGGPEETYVEPTVPPAEGAPARESRSGAAAAATEQGAALDASAAPPAPEDVAEPGGACEPPPPEPSDEAPAPEANPDES